MTIRVLLADDQTLVRSGFRLLLERTDDIEVAGEASTGVEALERLRAVRPDVVLMDIRMPAMDGIEATRQITHDPELAGVRVIILTTFGHDEYVFDALHAGASGFLLKDVEPDDLRQRDPAGPCRRGAAVAQRDPPCDRHVRRADGAGAGQRRGAALADRP